MCVTFEVAFQALPPLLHRYCTDEAQKTETVLSAVLNHIDSVAKWKIIVAWSWVWVSTPQGIFRFTHSEFAEFSRVPIEFISARVEATGNKRGGHRSSFSGSVSISLTANGKLQDHLFRFSTEQKKKFHEFVTISSVLLAVTHGRNVKSLLQCRHS